MKLVKELKSGEKFSFPGSKNIYTVISAVKGSALAKREGIKRCGIKLETNGGVFWCYTNELVNAVI